MTFAAGAVVMVAGGALGMTAASAAPPPGSVGKHQHYAVNGNGDRVRVGPDACRFGESRAFDEFHNNGHRGVPGDLGVVTWAPCSQ